jgi:hypothetical protein
VSSSCDREICGGPNIPQLCIIDISRGPLNVQITIRKIPFRLIPRGNEKLRTLTRDHLILPWPLYKPRNPSNGIRTLPPADDRWFVVPSHSFVHLLEHFVRPCILKSNTSISKPEPSFISERGMHNPSPAESLAPFHQDPAQRIIALHFKFHPRYLVLRVGTLLQLFKNHEGTEIGWDEWKDHLVFPSCSSDTLATRSVQVSGCRLIYFWPTAGGDVEWVK